MVQLDSSQPYCGLGSIENLNAHMQEVFAQAIVIPNSMLSKEFQDNTRGGRTIERLNKMAAKHDREKSAHKILKATKGRNIERMAAQLAAIDTAEMDFELDWSNNEVDENAKHRAECALINGMINGGVINADDLLED